MNRLKVFLINGFILTCTAFIIRFVGLSFGIYISNKIGAEAVGVFQLIISIYMFSITIATSGINLAVTSLVSRELAFNDKCNTNKLVKNCLFYSLIFGIISAIILSLSANFICSKLLHNKVSSYLFYIISISLPFISMSATLNGYFTALRKNGKNAINKIFEQSIKIISATYLLSLFMPSGLEYMCLSLVIGEAISEILSFIFAYFLYFFQKRSYIIPSSKKNFIKDIFSIALPVGITSYIRSGLSSLKQLLIPLRLEKSGLSCETAISNYGTINGMVLPILMFPEVIINSFSGLLVPEFTYFYTKKDFCKIKLIISKIFRISLLFSIGVTSIFLFYSDKISYVIYNNYTVSFYLKILCPLIAFMYLDSVVDNILKGLNEQLSVMKCNILDLFISIFCIFFLLPVFGIYGYLFVIFISELLNSGISILQLKKVTNFSFDFKNWIIKPFLASIFAYFVCSILVKKECTDTISLILLIFIFTCAYFLFLLITVKDN